MADLHKYKAHEILNKVLNSAETGLQVDIVSGAEYAEDSAHTSADTGNFVLGVRNDTLAALGGADGDYVPFQMNASGALYVEVATLPASTSTIEVVGDAAENAAAAGNPVLIGGRYDSSSRTLGDGDVGAIALDADGAVHITDGGNTITVDGTITANLSSTDNTVLDNIDSNTDYGATTGGGTESGALRVTIANDSTGVVSVDDGGGAITVDNGGTFAVQSTLQAGSAAIGKLAANSGVDIGDVDVTSVVPGTGATNLGKAEDAAHSSGDTGVMALAVRNDVLEALGGSDGDYASLQVTKTGALNVTETVGHLGAIFEDGTDDITSKKVVAIQFIEDTTFTTLTPVDSSYIGTASGNGDAIDTSNTFPQGMTIFGRWTGFRLASGTIVAYQGDW